MLCSLSRPALQQMLGRTPEPPQAKPTSKPPLPEWHAAYMQAAVQAAAASARGGDAVRSLVEAQLLPDEAPLVSAERAALERRWAGEHHRSAW